MRKYEKIHKERKELFLKYITEPFIEYVKNKETNPLLKNLINCNLISIVNSFEPFDVVGAGIRYSTTLGTRYIAVDILTVENWYLNFLTNE